MPLLTPVSAEVSADGWSSQSSGTLLSLYAVSGTSPSNVVASGDAGLVLHYDGNSWNSTSSGVLVPLYDIWSAPTGEVYAVGNAGTILHYDGSSWSQMASGVTNHLRGLWGSSPTDVFAAGNGGVILHYDGSSWTSMVSGTAAKLYAIWGSAASNVLAVGEGGTIVRYDGTSWATVSSGTTASLNGIWGTADDDVFVVGANGTTLHYDGVWSPMSSGTGSTLYGIWGTSSFNVYAVGTLGTILHYCDSPPTVTSVQPGQACQGETLTAAISGTNLNGTTLVDFGAGVNVTAFQVNLNGTQITADIAIDAAAAPGSRDVSVTTPAGTDTLAAAFTVQLPPPVPPVLTSVAPVSGLCGQSMTVVITGTNLNGATLVGFGADITITAFQVNLDGTQITADIAINATAIPGARDVSVTTAAGTGTLAAAFTVQLPPQPTPPVLTSVTPGSGISGQAMPVVITGTDINGVAIVDFGDGVTVTGLQVSPDGTQITADIAIDAAAAPGTRDVSVTTAAGSDILDGAFTVLIPFSYVVDVSPKSATIGETIDIVISGEKLENVIAVDFGPGIDVNSFSVDGPDRISARITIRQDAKAGYRDVSIVTLWSTYSQIEGFAVKAVPPSMASISDVDGSPGDVMTVTIEGANLVGVTRVSFGPGIEVQGFDMYPPDSLRVRISIAEDAEPGVRDVSVTTAPGGTYVMENAFEIAGPVTSPPPWAPIGAAAGAVMAGAGLLVFRGVLTLRGLRRP
jgi:hypothetical protein